MAIWSKILDYVGETAGALTSVIEAVRTRLSGDPETRRKVAFSIAMIALSAKMAKADGVVTEDEVDAFREIFEIPENEARNVARLYNLAKQDVAGYRAYAEKLASLCASGEKDCTILEDIIDGLFHIAKADGVLHDRELAFLVDVAGIFGIDDEHFEQIAARHIDGGKADPYRVLGVDRKADMTEVKRHYRRLVSENHPDRLISRGVPREFIAIANDRMAALNAAYEAIERERRAA